MARLPFISIMKEISNKHACILLNSGDLKDLYRDRPYWEMPVLVQRLCGICPVSHHLAAAKALDVIVGAGTGEGLTPTGEKMRRLMHYGQMFQSHSLHFFHLASPDLLFGIDSDPLKRNVIGVALQHRDLAVQGVMMRKYGQEVIKATAGKKIHGTGAIPGGINKHLTEEEREYLLHGDDYMNIDKMISWSQDALEFFKEYHKKNKAIIDGFCRISFQLSQPGPKRRCP